MRVTISCVVFLMLFALLLPPHAGRAYDPTHVEAVVYAPARADLDLLSEAGAIIIDRQGALAKIYADFALVKVLEKQGFTIIATSMAGVEPPDGKDTYLTHAQMVAELQTLAATYPAITRHWQIGTSAGGRSLDAFLISDNADTLEVEPSTLFDCSVHGDEAIANAICMNFIRHVLTEYGSDATITAAVDNTQIVFVPMLNPDGNDLGRRTNGNFVDINRDHPINYNYDTTGPGSQPETQIMIDLSSEFAFVNAVSFHSGAECVNYLWDSFPHDAPDYLHIESLATGYGAAVPGYFWVTNGWDWYEIHGSSEEGYYGVNGTIGQIVEISNIKKPSASQIVNFALLHRPAMMYWIEQSSQGIGGVITDAVTGHPVETAIFPDATDLWPSYNSLETGAYHRYLIPGTYDFKFSASGYQANNQYGINLAPAVLDISMSPSPTYIGRAIRVMGNYTDYPNSPSTPITMPYKVLGPSDSDAYSLNTGGWIIVDMGQWPIDDISGFDFTVHEVDDDEAYTVYGSDYWTGPWTLIGAATGTANFDLNTSGLAEARYIKIEDGAVDSGTDGADIDAIRFERACDTPSPDFIADVTAGPAPLTVNFTTQFDNRQGCILSVFWSFGDGNQSSEGQPTHQYLNPGLYTVHLTAGNPGTGPGFMQKVDYILVTAGDDDDDDISDDDDDDTTDDDDDTIDDDDIIDDDDDDTVDDDDNDTQDDDDDFDDDDVSDDDDNDDSDDDDDALDDDDDDIAPDDDDFDDDDVSDDDDDGGGGCCG